MTLEELLARDELWNPYDFANPVDQDRVFAGRDGQVKEIRYYLRFAEKAPRPINLVFTGARSAGKTSLLNKAANEATARGFCVARVDLNEADATPLPLFYKVYDAVLTAAVRKGAFGGVGGDTYAQYRQVMDAGISVEASGTELLFPRHYAAAVSGARVLSEPTIKADLESIADELGTPCVIIFDECDILGARRTELQMIRNVFMNTAGYLLIFAGTPNMFPAMEDVFSPIIRQFKKIPVEQFADVVDTRSCIEKPLHMLGLDPSDVLQQSRDLLYHEVHQLSGGRPYEIQLLCHYMFRRLEQGRARRMTLSVDVLDDVRRELETQEHGSEERRSVMHMNELGESDLKLFKILVSFEGTLQATCALGHLVDSNAPDPAELQDAVDRFVAIGILEVNPDGIIRFSGDQFDEVYARYAAAAKGVRLVVGRWDARTYASVVLRRQAFALEGFIPIPGLWRSSGNEIAVLTSTVAAFSGDADPDGPLLPDLAGDLYGPVLQAADHGVLHIVRIQLDIIEEELVIWGASSDTGATLNDPDFQAFQDRATLHGGAVTVQELDLPVPTRQKLLPNVRAMATPAQLPVFAQVHQTLGYDFHRVGDMMRALDEFASALALDPSVASATPCAHLSLIESGDWRAAESFAEYARQLRLSEETNDNFHIIQGAYAHYDLAVARVMQGRLEGVESLLEESLRHAGALADDEGYTAVPRRDAAGDLSITTSRSSLRDAVPLVFEVVSDLKSSSTNSPECATGSA